MFRQHKNIYPCFTDMEGGAPCASYILDILERCSLGYFKETMAAKLPSILKRAGIRGELVPLLDLTQNTQLCHIKAL